MQSHLFSGSKFPPACFSSWATLIVVALAVTTPSELVAQQSPTGTSVRIGSTINLLKAWPQIAAAPKSNLATFECLIKPDAVTISRSRAFVIVLSNRGGRDTAGIGVAIHQGIVHANILGTKLKSNDKLAVGKWAHIALTINTNTINKVARLWVNGKPTDEELVLKPWPQSFEVAEMLSDHWNQNRVFTGELGDVRFSNVVRYSSPFKPASRLPKDDDTVLRFEKGSIESR